MAKTFQAEKNHLTLCTAPKITQSQPKQELLMVTDSWKHRSRTEDVPASVVFHLLMMQNGHLTAVLASCSLVGKAVTAMHSRFM